MRNTIKCVISGKERITNRSYLKKRCDAVGVSEEEFRKYYVTRPTLTVLNKQAKVEDLGSIATQLKGGPWTGPDVFKMISQNGVRQKKVKA